MVEERWRLDHTTEWLSPQAILDTIEARMRAGELTTYLESDAGRIIGWSTNQERVMLMLLNGIGDAGEHALDPTGQGQSTGYVMDNGQVDTYPDADTIPVPEAQALLLSLVTHGTFPPDAPVQVDR
jgi:hypothetical protein